MADEKSENIESTFSTLVLSLASNAAISLGLATDPQTNTIQINKETAKFNINMLKVLKEKTTSNLSQEESALLDHILSDLQLKFVNTK